MIDGTMGDDTLSSGTLQMLRQLLQGAAPADATFTTGRGQGGIQKAQRDALEKLQANQQMVRGPRGRGEVSVRMGAPLNYTGAERTLNTGYDAGPGPSAVQGYQQGMFGNGMPDMGNAQAIGSRASDSLALSGLQRRTDSPLSDIELQLQIARLKALKARNSNNPG